MRGEPTRCATLHSSSGRPEPAGGGPLRPVCSKEPDLVSRCFKLAEPLLRDLWLAHDEVQKEAVLERLVRYGPRLQPSQVQPARREALQGGHQAAGRVRRDEAQRALGAGRRLSGPGRLAPLDDNEARAVAVVVLNALGQDFQTVAQSGRTAGHRGQARLTPFSNLTRRAGRVMVRDRL